MVWINNFWLLRGYLTKLHWLRELTISLIWISHWFEGVFPPCYNLGSLVSLLAFETEFSSWIDFFLLDQNKTKQGRYQQKEKIFGITDSQPTMLPLSQNDSWTSITTLSNTDKNIVQKSQVHILKVQFAFALRQREIFLWERVLWKACFGGNRGYGNKHWLKTYDLALKFYFSPAVCPRTGDITPLDLFPHLRPTHWRI